MSPFVMRWRKSNKLKTLSRIQRLRAAWHCYMYVCVWGGKVSIIPINHPLPASVSSWYVGELWESLITHTQAHTLHHYCQQLPCRPCEYPNNIIITSILQQCAPFQSLWPFAPQGTKRNIPELPLFRCPPQLHGAFEPPPRSSHYWGDLWPRWTCQREDGVSACQRTRKRAPGNEWEVCAWTCVYGSRRVFVSRAFCTYVHSRCVRLCVRVFMCYTVTV